MTPSVAYWTSALFPEMEAIAGEVALLRRHFRPSVAWGVSPARWLQLSWRRGFGVHPRMHLAFRAATWILQRAFRVNHLVGGLGDWFHLKAARKRPTVLTVAVDSAPSELRLLDRVDRFVVEWPAARDRLNALGIGRERIELVFPPVDLDRFSPNGDPDGQPIVLFASSPDRPDWLEARGVPLLLQAAERLPGVRFRLLWRPWGAAFEHVQRQIQQRGLNNVRLHRERVTDMSAEYRRAHLTIAPFTDISRCKAVPNSLVESLACGVPVVLTDGVGLADTVRTERCGCVASPTAESLTAAIERVLSERETLGISARRTAERWFSSAKFIDDYRRVYAQVL